LWLLVKLSQDYSTNISYPIEYKNNPINKININKLPTQINLKVSASGFEILKYKVTSDLIPIVLDIASEKLKILNSDTSINFIETISLLENINLQLSENSILKDIKITNVEPDTLFFQFTEMISKKVEIKLNADITYFRQFMLKDNIIISPDSLIVQGPAIVLDTVDYVETQYVKFENLKDNVEKEIKLKTFKNLIYSIEKTLITINVEQFTEADAIVAIQIKNLPDSLKLKIFPNKIKINYLVGFSNYNIIGEDEFIATIDFNDIKNNLTNKLKIKIEASPDKIKSFQFTPTSVEYLIEK